ncbi:MAG: hypothetical protein IJK64_01040 [Clostridia bacterium]|nr:hypothetical protein [Clostridia bacterium]
MKRVITFLIAAIILLSCTTWAFAGDDREDVSQQVNTNVSPLYVVEPCTLFVNGKEVKGYEDDVKIYYNDDGFSSAQLPLIATIKALGGVVFWLSPTKALIFVRATVLYFDLEKAFLFCPFRLYNYVSPNLLETPLAGGSGVYEQYALDREYVFSEDSWLMLKLLLGITIHEDIDSAAIKVEKASVSEIIGFR